MDMHHYGLFIAKIVGTLIVMMLMYYSDLLLLYSSMKIA